MNDPTNPIAGEITPQPSRVNREEPATYIHDLMCGECDTRFSIYSEQPVWPNDNDKVHCPDWRCGNGGLYGFKHWRTTEVSGAEIEDLCPRPERTPQPEPEWWKVIDAALLADGYTRA